MRSFRGLLYFRSILVSINSIQFTFLSKGGKLHLLYSPYASMPTPENHIRQRRNERADKSCTKAVIWRRTFLSLLPEINDIITCWCSLLIHLRGFMTCYLLTKDHYGLAKVINVRFPTSFIKAFSRQIYRCFSQFGARLYMFIRERRYCSL